MQNSLEDEKTAFDVITKTALIEVPFIFGGVIAWFLTGQWIWLVVGVGIGGALWIPAMSKLKRIQERDNAAG